MLLSNRVSVVVVVLEEWRRIPEHADKQQINSFRFYDVSQNDTDAAHYNFNAHQPILVIFGRDVAERVRYQKEVCYP